MKKKSGYLKLCLDPNLEKEAQKVRKGAIIISVIISVLVAIIALIVVFFA